MARKKRPKTGPYANNLQTVSPAALARMPSAGLESNEAIQVGNLFKISESEKIAATIDNLSPVIVSRANHISGGREVSVKVDQTSPEKENIFAKEFEAAFSASDDDSILHGCALTNEQEFIDLDTDLMATKFMQPENVADLSKNILPQLSEKNSALSNIYQAIDQYEVLESVSHEYARFSNDFLGKAPILQIKPKSKNYISAVLTQRKKSDTQQNYYRNHYSDASNSRYYSSGVSAAALSYPTPSYGFDVINKSIDAILDFKAVFEAEAAEQLSKITNASLDVLSIDEKFEALRQRIKQVKSSILNISAQIDRHFSQLPTGILESSEFLRLKFRACNIFEEINGLINSYLMRLDALGADLSKVGNAWVQSALNSLNTIIVQFNAIVQNIADASTSAYQAGKSDVISAKDYSFGLIIESLDALSTTKNHLIEDFKRQFHAASSAMAQQLSLGDSIVSLKNKLSKVQHKLCIFESSARAEISNLQNSLSSRLDTPVLEIPFSHGIKELNKVLNYYSERFELLENSLLINKNAWTKSAAVALEGFNQSIARLIDKFKTTFGIIKLKADQIFDVNALFSEMRPYFSSVSLAISEQTQNLERWFISAISLISNCAHSNINYVASALIENYALAKKYMASVDQILLREIQIFKNSVTNLADNATLQSAFINTASRIRQSLRSLESQSNQSLIAIRNRFHNISDGFVNSLNIDAKIDWVNSVIKTLHSQIIAAVDSFANFALNGFGIPDLVSNAKTIFMGMHADLAIQSKKLNRSLAEQWSWLNSLTQKSFSLAYARAHQVQSSIHFPNDKRALFNGAAAVALAISSYQNIDFVKNAPYSSLSKEINSKISSVFSHSTNNSELQSSNQQNLTYQSNQIRVGRSFYANVDVKLMSPVKMEQKQEPSVELKKTAAVNSNLEDLAQTGQAENQYQLGINLLASVEQQKDPELAALWITRAAEQGYALAQLRLGMLYEKGEGVVKDAALSMKWYRKGAEAGNVRSMHNLAVSLSKIVGKKNNSSEALHWFNEAASFGFKDSQFNLGLIYSKGIFVKQNLLEAYKWFELAARQGDQEAINMRDDIGRKIQLDEIDTARLNADRYSIKSANSLVN